jgi:hypothetical protein
LIKNKATPGNGATWLSYSQEDLQARKYIEGHIQALGLTVREDGLGIIFGETRWHHSGSTKCDGTVLAGKGDIK